MDARNALPVPGTSGRVHVCEADHNEGCRRWLGFDIHYQAQPNWRTYRAVLEMTEVYFELLGEFGPLDFIDVQSFFWVTGEAYGQR